VKKTLIVAFLTPIAVGAQTAFGTKADMVAKPAANAQATGMMPLFQMLIALVIVGAALKWGMPFLIQKFGKQKLNSQGSLKIEETLPFAGGHLYIVNVRDRQLLLSVTGTSVNCLADLSEPGAKLPEPPLFAEIVQKEVDRPNVAPFALVNDDDVDARKAVEALDRLERLLGR
jgi:flagellar biogenesis protein FliO